LAKMLHGFVNLLTDQSACRLCVCVPHSRATHNITLSYPTSPLNTPLPDPLGGVVLSGDVCIQVSYMVDSFFSSDSVCVLHCSFAHVMRLLSLLHDLRHVLLLLARLVPYAMLRRWSVGTLSHMLRHWCMCDMLRHLPLSWVSRLPRLTRHLWSSSRIVVQNKLCHFWLHTSFTGPRLSSDDPVGVHTCLPCLSACACVPLRMRLSRSALVCAVCAVCVRVCARARRQSHTRKCKHKTCV
jgi:hypothetical protein